MRRPLIALAALGLIGAAASPAQAWQTYHPAPVQYYAPGYHAPGWQHDRWERRQAWRAHRRAEEAARIEEAARREAWRIEQEREARRAWRHAQRMQYGQWGHGGGHWQRW